VLPRFIGNKPSFGIALRVYQFEIRGVIMTVRKVFS
jgi:hypothetical protein